VVIEDRVPRRLSGAEERPAAISLPGMSVLSTSTRPSSAATVGAPACAPRLLQHQDRVADAEAAKRPVKATVSAEDAQQTHDVKH